MRRVLPIARGAVASGVARSAAGSSRAAWGQVQRRGFASEGEGEQKQKEKKDPPPKAGPGFWETFKKSFRDQMTKRQAEDIKFKEARETVDHAREDAGAAAARAYEAAQRAAEEAKKRADVIDEKTRPARDKIGEKVGQGLGIVGKVAQKVGENPAVKATGAAAMKAAEAIMDAHDNIDRRSEQIEKKLLDSKLGKSIRHTFGSEPQNVGRVEGKEIDKETMGLSVREETPWERRMRKIKESAFLGPIVTAGENVAVASHEAMERAGDRVFGENETSICIGEIKKDDPRWKLQPFLDKLQAETIPMVLTAFLENKIEPLQKICTERSLSQLGFLIKERLSKGLTPDSHILDLEEVALQEARLVDGEPVLLISFQTQQVHCLRNKKGEIVEGGESKIQQIFYLWAMVRHFPEDPAMPPEWRLHEMAIQHQMYLLT
mmetsp:Transcript_29945/g.73695  ORF Transcript_29945/g.73695 Transcript_29945/m.73695 type:complete len:434 (-) Transcript_29945:386-1687(-)